MQAGAGGKSDIEILDQLKQASKSLLQSRN
jgi:hypothetical protein